MVKKATTKKTVAKTAPKKRTVKTKAAPARPATVDYYPNRMTLAISLLAAVLLLLLGVIVTM